MNISEQVTEIMTANGPRIQEIFRDVSQRVKVYKRAINVWSFETVEERALETLLEQALTEHLEKMGVQQTLVTREFYTLVITGRPQEGIKIQVLHPLSEQASLLESFDGVQRMIESAYDGS